MHRPAELGPDSTMCESSSTDCGPKSANFGPTSVNFGRLQPNRVGFDRTWGEVGRSWPRLAQIVSCLAEPGPNSARVLPNLTKSGRPALQVQSQHRHHLTRRRLVKCCPNQSPEVDSRRIRGESIVGLRAHAGDPRDGHSSEPPQSRPPRRSNALPCFRHLGASNEWDTARRASELVSRRRPDNAPPETSTASIFANVVLRRSLRRWLSGVRPCARPCVRCKLMEAFFGHRWCRILSLLCLNPSA